MIKQTRISRSVSIASVIATLLSAGSANAQIAAVPAPVTDPQPAPQTSAEPAADEGDANGLQDIVVTAQRRSENLQRAAVAVTAVTGDALAQAGVSDINNLTKLVPALVVQPQGGSSTNFYLRGVGSFGTNAFAENPVAFNFAGVYIARPTSPVGTLFDLQRLEVVKGPQGTLYGRNATGGAINVIPAPAVIGRTSYTVTGEYANYDSKKLSGAVNIPLGNMFALRVAGQLVDRDAYISDGYDDEQGQAARASLLFRPNDRFSMTLIADYFHQGGKGVGSVLIPGSTVPTAPNIVERIAGSDPRSLAELRLRFPTVVTGVVQPPKSDGFLDSSFYGATLLTEGDVGFGTLSTVLGYRRSEPDFLQYNNGFLGRVIEEDDQMSAEVRLASNGSGPLNYVLGAYYFFEQQRAQNTFSQGPISITTSNPKIETESRAVFGQATYGLTETFRVVGGVRYTDEAKTLSTSLKQQTPANPNPTPTQITGDLSFDRVTWKAGLEWEPRERSLVYANVATGFKAGGFYVAAVNNTSRPEKLTAYTIGSKNRFLDNRLQLNGELFYWSYKDQQVNFVGPAQFAPGVFGPGGITVNAGNARMFGADIDVLFQATPNDQFGVNLQYLNSKYNSFVYTAFSGTGAPVRSGCAVTLSSSVPVNAPARLYSVDCSGRPALNAPRWSLNLAYEHKFDLGAVELLAGGRSRIESSRYLAIDYVPEELQKGYTSSDLFLTMQSPGGRLSLTGFVNNVEDRTILASATQRQFIPAVYGALRPPRTYGLRLTVRDK